MKDWLPVFAVVQISLPILMLAASVWRRRHETGEATVFRYSAVVAWFLTAGCFSIVTFGIVVIETAVPTAPSQPYVVMLIDCAFFALGLYGIHCITMRIRLFPDAFQVTSVFSNRLTTFAEVRSVQERQTGQWRTLDVIDRRGKRVLYVTSSFLGDYDILADKIQTGSRKHYKAHRGQVFD